jgi:hypothetical protein
VNEEAIARAGLQKQKKKLKGRDQFRDIKHIWEDNIKPYVKNRVS